MGIASKLRVYGVLFAKRIRRGRSGEFVYRSTAPILMLTGMRGRLLLKGGGRHLAPRHDEPI